MPICKRKDIRSFLIIRGDRHHFLPLRKEVTYPVHCFHKDQVTVGADTDGLVMQKAKLKIRQQCRVVGKKPESSITHINAEWAEVLPGCSISCPLPRVKSYSSIYKSKNAWKIFSASFDPQRLKSNLIFQELMVHPDVFCFLLGLSPTVYSHLWVCHSQNHTTPSSELLSHEEACCSAAIFFFNWKWVIAAFCFLGGGTITQPRLYWFPCICNIQNGENLEVDWKSQPTGNVFCSSSAVLLISDHLLSTRWHLEQFIPCRSSLDLCVSALPVSWQVGLCVKTLSILLTHPVSYSSFRRRDSSGGCRNLWGGGRSSRE